MKQIKFKQLATFGLCCSLLVNSLTGVTAVAETVTIESSPTVESSVKEKTTKASTEESAGASTKESAEESTQNSEVLKQETTTETTEEIKQTEEAKVISQKLIQPMIGTEDYYNAIRADLVSFAAGDSREDLSFTLPAGKIAFDITTSDTPTLNMADFNLSAELKVLVRPRANDNLVNITSREVLIEKAQDSLAIIMPEKTSVLPYAESFKSSIDYLDNIQLTVPKYVQSTNIVGDIVNQYVSSPATSSLLNGPYELIAAQAILSKINDSDFEIHTNFNESTTFYNEDTGTTVTIPVIFRWWLQRNGLNTMNSMYMPKQNPVITVVLKKVTENFKDINGTAIPAPTGFTQGKQTSITNNDYTFTQGGTLPEVYTANNGKAYKFKGWYKGKTKPATLETSKTPSYKVTYDDNDDLNVVYEETEAFEFPALTYQFGFVDESGQRVDASTIGLTYDNWRGENFASTAAESNDPAYSQTVTLEKGQVAPTKNNLKEINYPAQTMEIVAGKSSQSSAVNITFTLPKYYEKISVYNKNDTFDSAYPFPNVQSNNNPTPIVEDENKRVSGRFELKANGKQSFVFNQTTVAAPIDIQLPSYLRKVVFNPNLTSSGPVYYTLDKPVYYYLTNRKVTENFVDAMGAKITPPASFKQGKQTVIDSDNFTYTSAKALPASYTADGKSYVLQGWYKGTEKPATLETSKTPSYSVTYNDQDDLTVVYKEGTISADLTMRGAVDVIDNGAPMEYWEVLLKNTGEVPLTSIKIKPTTDWASGISAPTELFILGTGQNTKARPITKEQWEAGFEIPLDNSLPVGGQLTINLIGTKVTGQPGQVLEAAVEVTGNFGNLKASDTVRIKDLDQEIKEPTGEGFISVPTFDFGQVGVASATKQHGLKKAADYYGNGTRNPYVRISKTQPNWSLTAQLSQPKSATDSLPTATRLLLGAAPVSSFSNYNQPTELKNAIGTTNAIHLTANNAATSIIANQQFTGSDVYQLDFTFDNIKLEVPANQGTAGQQYQAAVTWNLVTGP
ncbi:WxL domain-containing protein [Enterococcus faecalis]